MREPYRKIVGGAVILAASISSVPVSPLDSCSTPAPSTAAQYRQAFDNLDDSQWAGADQTTTVALPNGRTAWLFGDTTGPGYFSHNSIVIQNAGCFTVKRPAIPDNPNGTYYWPTHGVVDGNQLHVFAHRIRNLPGSFEVQGTEVAKFNLYTLKYTGKYPTPSASTPDTNVHWGSSVHRQGSYIYVYGSQKVIGEWIFGMAGYVARVPVGKLADLTQWRYWNGSSWVANAGSAKKILSETTHGMSPVWSSYYRNGQWIIVHKKHSLFGDQIVSLRSSTPYGPWTEKHLLTTPPWTAKASNYNPAAHPHLALASGKTLVSLNFNSPNVFSDFSLYRPKFYELEP